MIGEIVVKRAVAIVRDIASAVITVGEVVALTARDTGESVCRQVITVIQCQILAGFAGDITQRIILDIATTNA